MRSSRESRRPEVYQCSPQVARFGLFDAYSRVTGRYHAVGTSGSAFVTSPNGSSPDYPGREKGTIPGIMRAENPMNPGRTQLPRIIRANCEFQEGRRDPVVPGTIFSLTIRHHSLW